MTEKPQGPWTPSRERLLAEAERDAQKALQDAIRTFASMHRITYEIKTTFNGYRVLPNGGDFAKLATYIRETVEAGNKVMEGKNIGFYVEVEEYNNGLQVQFLKEKK